MSLLDDLIKKAGGKVPRASSAERDYEAQFGSTDLEKYTLPEDFQSYDTYGVQYDPKDPIGSAEARANNQSTFEVGWKALTNVAVTAAKGVIEIPGYLGGMAVGAVGGTALGINNYYQEATGGKEGRSGWEFASTTAFNNFYLQSTEALKNSIDENVLKIYVPPSVQEGGLWDKVSSFNYMASTGSEMTGFVLSMYAPGAIVGKLGWGADLIKGLNAAEEVGATLTAGAKVRNAAAKAFVKGSDFIFGEDDIIKAVAGNSKLGRVTGEGLGLATNADDAARVAASTQATATEIANTLGEATKAIKWTNSAARATDTGLAITFNTALESASEATQSYRDVYKAALAKGYTEDDARRAAATSATGVFSANMSILAVTNILGEKFILDGFARAAKGADNNKVAKTLMQDILGSTETNIDKLLKENWFNTSTLGKTLVGRGADKVGRLAGKFALGGLKEGVLEEGMQTNVSQVAKADVLKGEKSFERGGIPGASSILNLINGVANYGTLFTDKGNSELAESMLMGAIFAGAIEGVRGSANLLSSSYKKETAARKEGYNALRNNFKYTFTSFNDAFEREPKELPDGKANPIAGNIKLDDNGLPVMKAEAAEQLSDVAKKRILLVQRADAATAIDANSLEAEILNNAVEENIFLDMLGREGGAELMRLALETGQLEKLITARFAANNNGQVIDPQVLSTMMDRWKTKGKEVASKLNYVRETHNPEAYIRYDKNNPEEVKLFTRYSNDLLDERYSNYSLHEQVKAKRTEVLKENSGLEAAQKALDIRTANVNFTGDTSTLDPAALAQQAVNAQQYQEANDLFESYAAESSVYSGFGESDKPNEEEATADARYKEIQIRQDALNNTLIPGGTTSLPQHEMEFKAAYEADRDALVAHLKKVNALRARKKAIEGDTKHVYNINKTERNLIAAEQKQLDVMKKEVADKLEELNKLELGVVDKYKPTGEKFMKSWDTYKSAEMKAKEEEKKEVASNQNAANTLKNNMIAVGYTESEIAEITAQLINSGINVNTDTGKFEDLEFTLNVDTLRAELNQLDKADPSYSSRKTFLERFEAVSKNVKGSWKIINVATTDGRNIKMMISNGTMEYPKATSDLEATVAKFPLAFEDRYGRKQKLTDAQIAAKIVALRNTLTGDPAADAEIQANIDALNDTVKNFKWQEKTVRTSRHLILMIDNSEKRVSWISDRENTVKRISKFAETSVWYSTKDADGTLRIVKDFKRQFSRRSTNTAEQNKKAVDPDEQKKIINAEIEYHKKWRMEQEPLSAGADQMIPNVGPGLNIGNITARDLIRSMIPINKNIVKNDRIAKSLVRKKEVLNTALAAMNASFQADVARLENDILNVKNTQQTIDRMKVDLQRLKLSTLTTPDRDALMDELNTKIQEAEEVVRALLGTYSSLKEAVEGFEEKRFKFTQYKNAVDLLIKTIRTLSDEELYNLDPSNIFSILTPEGTALLNEYLQNEKDEINERINRDISSVRALITAKEANVAAANVDIEALRKDIKELEAIYLTSIGNALKDTFDEAKLKARFNISSLDDFAELAKLKAEITKATAVLDKQTASAVQKQLDETDKLIGDQISTVVTALAAIPAANLSSGATAMLAILHDIYDKIQGSAATNSAEKLKALHDLNTVFDTIIPDLIKANDASKDVLEVFLTSVTQDVIDEINLLTSRLNGVVYLNDALIRDYEELKGLLLVSTTTIQQGIGGAVKQVELSPADLQKKYQAVVNKLVAIGDNTRKAREEKRQNIDKLRAKIAVFEKEITRMKEVLNDATTTQFDFENIKLDPAGDVIIEDFRDLYNAVRLAYKQEKLESDHVELEGYAKTIADSLEMYTNIQKQTEQELIKLKLNSIASDDYTAKLSTLLEIIPQLTEIFKDDTQAKLAAVRVIFQRTASKNVSDEEVLRAMLNPFKVRIALGRYIDNYNAYHKTNIDSTLKPTITATGTADDSTDYDAVLDSYVEALDNTNAARTLMGKIKALEEVLTKLQASSLAVVDSSILDMSDFMQTLNAAYVASTQQYFATAADIVTSQKRFNTTDDPHGTLNATFFSRKRASNTGDRTIGAPEVDPDNEYGLVEIELPNGNVQQDYKLIIRGEYYQARPASYNKPAVYKRIVLPTDTDPAKEATWIGLYFNDTSLDDITLKNLGLDPAAVQVDAIKEFRKYHSNNAFFTWVDLTASVRKDASTGKLFFSPLTYSQLRNHADPDVRAIADKLDQQLALDTTNESLKSLIHQDDNVILVPHQIVEEVDASTNNAVKKLRPVKYLTPLEETFNKTANEVNKRTPSVMFSVRPLASTMYPKIDAANTNELANLKMSEDILNTVNRALGFELGNASKSKLNDAALGKRVAEFNIKITYDQNTKELTIKYSVEGKDVTKVISNIAPIDGNAIANHNKPKDDISQKDKFARAITLGLLAKQHKETTNKLIMSSDKYLRFEKLNRGIPNYVRRRVVTAANKDLKFVPSELVPVMSPVSQIETQLDATLNIVIVTQANKRHFPDREVGDPIATTVTQNQGKKGEAMTPGIVIPVINALYGEASSQMKDHRNNMIDVLGLVMFQAVETSGSFAGLREVKSAFPGGTIIPIEASGGKKVEISGYTLMPDNNYHSKSMSAIEFFLNFGQRKDGSTPQPDLNQIYISNGKLIFTQTIADENGIKKAVTTEIVITDLIENKTLNLRKALQTAKDDTPLGKKLVLLNQYLNNKRANVSKKLLNAPSGKVTFVPIITTANGVITSATTLGYKQQNYGYRRYAKDNLLRTNFDATTGRKFIQKNVEHSTELYDENDAIKENDRILQAQAEAIAKAKAERDAKNAQLKAQKAAKNAPAASGITSTAVPADFLADLEKLANTVDESTAHEINNLATKYAASKSAVVVEFTTIAADLDFDVITKGEAIQNVKSLLSKIKSTPISLGVAPSNITGVVTLSEVDELATYLKAALPGLSRTAAEQQIVDKILDHTLMVGGDISLTVEDLTFLAKANSTDINNLIAKYAPVANTTPAPPINNVPPVNNTPPPPTPTADPLSTFKDTVNKLFPGTGDVNIANLIALDITTSNLRAQVKALVPDIASTVGMKEYTSRLGAVINALKTYKNVVPSKFKDSSRRTIQLAEARRNMAAIFGQKFADEDVQMVVGLIGGEGYGAFTEDGKILLSDLTSAGTEYHEAFHRVWRMYIPTSKRAELIAEFETRADKEQVLADIRAAGYTGSREYLIEEALAEEFKLYSDKYKYKNGKLVPKNTIERWFDKLIKFLRALIGRPVQQQFYDDILAGKYKNVAPKYKYAQKGLIYSRNVYFDDITKDSGTLPVMVSTADISALNSAITIDMFNRQLANGRIYELLTSEKVDASEEYAAALIEQATSVLGTAGKYVSHYDRAADKLAAYKKLMTASNMPDVYKYFLADPFAAIEMYHKTGILSGLLNKLVDRYGEQLSESLATIETYRRKASSFSKGKPTEDLEDIEEPGGLISIIQKLILLDVPKIDNLDTEKMLTDIGLDMNEMWDVYGNTINPTFDPMLDASKSTRSIDVIALAAMQEILLKSALQNALSTGLGNINSEVLKKEIKKQTKKYNSKTSEANLGFFQQWKNSVANMGGKLKSVTDKEALELELDEENVTSKNASYDKLVYEIDPYSSMSLAIKLLIHSIPQKVTVLKDGVPTEMLNLHPELGIVQRIHSEKIITKMLNKLASVPAYAMWTEFTNFVSNNPEIASMQHFIEAIENEQNKAKIKVKLGKVFGNHLYTFLLTLVDKNYVSVTNANADTAANAIREEWKNNFQNSTAEQRSKLYGKLVAKTPDTTPPVFTNHNFNEAQLELAKLNWLIKKNLEYLGIVLDTRATDTPTKASKVWELINSIYANAASSPNNHTWSRSATAFTKGLFEKGGSAENSTVDSKLNALAEIQAEYQDDKSQSIFSGGKALYAINLNSNMTLVGDNLNYVNSLTLSEIDAYIKSELAVPEQAYYSKANLLETHARSWLSSTMTPDNANNELFIARTKLLLLTSPHLFNNLSKHSILLSDSITSDIGSTPISIGVYDSVKSKITGEVVSVDELNMPELITLWATSAEQGYNRVIQHSDRSMAYSVRYLLTDQGVGRAQIAKVLEDVAEQVLNLYKRVTIGNTTEEDKNYLGHNVPKMASVFKGNMITPDSFGMLSDLVEHLYKFTSLKNGYTNFHDFALNVLKPGQGVFANKAQLNNAIELYVEAKQNELIRFADENKVLTIEQYTPFDDNGNALTPVFRGLYINNTAIKPATTQDAAREQLKTILKMKWLQSFITHMEEAMLFTGNPTLYKSAEDMFKRMSNQSSTGIPVNVSSETIAMVKQLDTDAAYFNEHELNLDADAYTNPNSIKNRTLITETIGSEEEFNSDEMANNVYDSQYELSFNMAKLQGKSDTEANKISEALATSMADDYRDKVNENDGITLINMFADRQYRLGTDKWSEAQQNSFVFETLVLDDAIDAIDSGRAEYTPLHIIAARQLLNRLDLTEEQYDEYVSDSTIVDTNAEVKVTKGQQFVKSIDTFLLKHMEGISPSKPHYAGPVYLNEEHRTSNPLTRTGIIGVRKTAFDQMLPSMLRGKTPATRTKLFDMMRNMHRLGIDILPMESAAKVGTKAPKPLWDVSKEYTEFNSELLNPENHTFLEWKFMKDQQNIDTSQKTSLKDSIQARKNMLANQTHYGVPIDYPMYVETSEGNKVYYSEKEWVTKWRSLSEQQKLEASELYTLFQAALQVQKDMMLQAVENLEEALKINEGATEQITEVVRILKENANNRLQADNVITAIETIIAHGYIDILSNRAVIEPILMSLVTNNLITLKRHGNAVPQLASTGLDPVGTKREKVEVTVGGKKKFVVQATAALKSYTINEDGSTEPAEIIMSLPVKYRAAVLKKYTERAGRPITLFEAVDMLNEDLARPKGHPKHMQIEIFALRIPNQQMSSNDVFKVKQFYIGTKENFVYVPSDIVVKAGSDFDIDKLQMYFPNMDKDFNEVQYEGGTSSLANTSKVSFNEFNADNIDMNELINQMIANGTIEKEDCTGTQNAEDGAVTANFTPGGRWKTVEKLEGPSHKEGGVDLQINKDGDVTFKNASGAVITAAAGLVIPNIN